jgi:hypothetical protein
MLTNAQLADATTTVLLSLLVTTNAFVQNNVDADAAMRNQSQLLLELSTRTDFDVTELADLVNMSR